MPDALEKGGGGEECWSQNWKARKRGKFQQALSCIPTAVTIQALQLFWHSPHCHKNKGRGLRAQPFSPHLYRLLLQAWSGTAKQQTLKVVLGDERQGGCFSLWGECVEGKVRTYASPCESHVCCCPVAAMKQSLCVGKLSQETPPLS